MLFAAIFELRFLRLVRRFFKSARSASKKLEKAKLASLKQLLFLRFS